MPNHFHRPGFGGRGVPVQVFGMERKVLLLLLLFLLLSSAASSSSNGHVWSANSTAATTAHQRRPPAPPLRIVYQSQAKGLDVEVWRVIAEKMRVDEVEWIPAETGTAIMKASRRTQPTENALGKTSPRKFFLLTSKPTEHTSRHQMNVQKCACIVHVCSN